VSGAYGWRPNIADARDWDEQKLGLPVAAPGDILHMIGLHTTLDQNASSSCTGHGVVQEMCVSLRAAYKRQHPEVTKLELQKLFPIGSPLAAYYFGRRQEDPNAVKVQDVGAFPRLVKQAVSVMHVPKYGAWPTDLTKVNRKPSPTALIRGMRAKKATFYFFKGTGEARLAAIDAALAADKPVGFGTAVSDEMSGRSGEFVLDVPRGPISGLHYMCIIGMRVVNGQRQYAVVQSYGNGYGVDGIFWMTDNYIAWHMTSDVGCLSDLGESA